MRRKLIAGNWKMNLTRAEAVELAQGIVRGVASLDGVDVAVFPPFVYVDAVRQVLAGSNVAWGLQNVSDEPNGAFTGEISVAMARDLGCKHVIVGHSERRQKLGETDATINRKTMAALAGGLFPIVCVGETLAQREAGQTMEVISAQVAGSLANLTADQMMRVVIAYEPVWAIGTGRNATPEQAEEVHLALRNLLAARYNGQVAQNVRIQYGGSVKASNARDLLSQPDIDGALVGGASLQLDQFLGIVAAAKA